jgi:hypothetical protein
MSARAAAIASCVAFELVVAAVFGVALTLDPSPSGHGTHTQLGLPACAILRLTGIPCPACGMTTAFAHLAHGGLLSAFATQPFAALLGCALAFGSIGLPVAIARGARLSDLRERLLSERLALAYLVLFVAAWLYKVLLVA